MDSTASLRTDSPLSHSIPGTLDRHPFQHSESPARPSLGRGGQSFLSSHPTLGHDDNQDDQGDQGTPLLSDSSADNTHPDLPSFALFSVHALCTFDERLYEFASYFFIMEIFKTTLLPMSVYGFSTTVAGILFSTTVGSLVDMTPRLAAVQSFLFAQKFTTFMGAIGFFVLLTCFDPSQSALPESATATIVSWRPSLSLYQGYSLFALLVLISGILKLSALGWSISIERDWIVSLCRSKSETLTHLNVTMKRIDLVCKLISPLVFAGLMAILDVGYCSLVMAIWCLISFTLELFLVRRIWHSSPVLWEPRSVLFHTYTGPKKQSQPVSGRRVEGHTLQISVAQSQHTGNMACVKKVFSRGVLSFQEYYGHVVFLASLSYAIIYINMMSVSGTMIGYLQWRGLTAGSIALLKGVCTASELLGTIAMPVMTRQVGLVRSGAWSIWLEVVTLTPVLLSIYSDRLPIQAMIFAGMALSRVGVWSFDLVITQIMQEYIESGASAGVINGWHFSMMNFFELGQFVLTMIWSDPQAYYIPCTLSYICVVAGAIVYSGYLVKMRGHLIHYHRLASAATSCLSRGEPVGSNEPGPSNWAAHSSCNENLDEGSGVGVIIHRSAQSREPLE